MIELEVAVNEPFQARLIKHLYADPTDLKLAFPNSKIPFCELEWTALFAKDPENSSLLFKHQDQIIGHIAFMPKAEDIYLCCVILLKEYRGKNFAEKMITQAEEFCRLNYPHLELFLNVDKKNVRAHKLYAKLGYKVWFESDDKMGMKKALRNYGQSEIIE